MPIVASNCHYPFSPQSTVHRRIFLRRTPIFLAPKNIERSAPNEAFVPIVFPAKIADFLLGEIVLQRPIDHGGQIVGSIEEIHAVVFAAMRHFAESGAQHRQAGGAVFVVLDGIDARRQRIDS